MNNKKHVAKYDGEVKVSHSVFNTLHPVFQASILKRKADRERLKEEKEQKHETPAEAPRNARSESAKVIRDLVKDAKEQVRKGATTEVTNELTEKIRRKLNLHGAEYMSSGEASEVFDRIFNQISEEYYQYRRAHPEVLKREQEEVKQEKALKEKAEEVKQDKPLKEKAETRKQQKIFPRYLLDALESQVEWEAQHDQDSSIHKYSKPMIKKYIHSFLHKRSPAILKTEINKIIDDCPIPINKTKKQTFQRSDYTKEVLMNDKAIIKYIYTEVRKRTIGE